MSLTRFANCSHENFYSRIATILGFQFPQRSNTRTVWTKNGDCIQHRPAFPLIPVVDANQSLNTPLSDGSIIDMEFVSVPIQQLTRQFP